MRERALITGLTGFVGSHLCDYLIDTTDWEIHGLLRTRSPLHHLARHIERINRKDRIFLHYGDLNDTPSLFRAVDEAQPHYVFHLAAQSFPLNSFHAPLETLETNILGTCRLLEAIRRWAPAAKVHVCASSEIFGRVTKDKLPINEECSLHPASPYALSKAGTDLLGRYYAEAYEMNVQTTRMFSHTGPRRGDWFAESSFAKQIAMIEAGLSESVIKVGNLESMRTWADVRDAVAAYHMLLTVNPLPGAYYNIGGDFSCTIGDMLHTLIKFSDLNLEGFLPALKRTTVTVETDPARLRPLDADLQVPDTTKFREHTSWRPLIPFEQTMVDLLEYWRERVRREGPQLTR